MAMMVVLVDGGAERISLSQAALTALGRFGVTSIALARDDRTAGVVLEGWAFDPAQAGEEAVAVLAASAAATARALYPVLQIAVSANAASSHVLPSHEGRAGPAGIQEER